MKRNLDLIRDILLYIENSNQTSFTTDDFFSLCKDSTELAYNIHLICSAGLVKANGAVTSDSPFPFPLYRIYYLTNYGCDYIDSIREQTVWNKTKELLLKVGGSASLEVVKMVATKIVLSILS